MTHRRRQRAGLLVAGLVCLLAASCPVAFALNPNLQIVQYAHTVWTVRDGFSKGRITSITQTSDGYLWLGTEFGLLRFDGVRAVPWNPPAGPSLPSDFVTRVFAARDGTLWIGTLKGLASWKDGKLAVYNELRGQDAFRILQDRDGTVWVGSYGRPTGRLCSIRSGAVQCYGEDGRFGTAVTSLDEDSHGSLWVGGQNSLWRWNPGSPKSFAISEPQGQFNGVVEDEDGSILIAKGPGILRLSGDSAVPYHLSKTSLASRPNRFFRDRDGGLWMGSNNYGLFHIYRGRTDVFGQTDGLSGDDVSDVIEDREGNIWVSTDEGLDCFRELVVTTTSVREGLSARGVGSVLASRDGSVWVGTADGLDRLRDGKVTVYRRDSIQDSAGRKSIQTGLPDNLVQSLGEDNQGRIWVGTLRGVAYFDGGRFVRPERSALDGQNVHAISADAAGNLWISTDSGLFQFSPQSLMKHTSWAELGRKDDAATITPDTVRGALWLGFFQGGLANFRDGQLKTLDTGASLPADTYVTGIRQDRDGSLWVASQAGLSHVKDGKTNTLSGKNGLPCDTVHWAIEDDAGSVWLRMSCGLVSVPRSELDAWASSADRGVEQRVQAMLFNTSDGVEPAAFPTGYAPRAAKSSDGRIWFSASEGVAVLDPLHLPSNKLVPPVHVEQITADHKTYDMTASPAASPRLPPLVRDLEVNYTALSFIAPQKVQFRYKLEGWDRDWQEAGNRRQAYYGNLPPGDYRFRVTAGNNSGVWNETGDYRDFSIAPAYYQTVWFRALCAIAFLGMLWGIYELRRRQLQHEFSMNLEARVEERTRIARDLHDTLLQSFQGLLLRFQTVANLLPLRPLDAKEKLESAIDLTAQAITEGRDAVQGLRRTATVNDLAVALNSLGQGLAADHEGGPSAKFSVELEGTPRDLHPILRDEVYRIAAEALRNSFLHAQARHVELEVRYDNRLLRLRVRDDGKGIDPGVLTKGGRDGHFGLHGMRERAKMIGGKLDVWSNRNSGTEVELSIPASKAYVTPSTSQGTATAGKFSGKGTAVS